MKRLQRVPRDPPMTMIMVLYALKEDMMTETLLTTAQCTRQIRSVIKMRRIRACHNGRHSNSNGTTERITTSILTRCNTDSSSTTTNNNSSSSSKINTMGLRRIAPESDSELPVSHFLSKTPTHRHRRCLRNRTLMNPSTQLVAERLESLLVTSFTIWNLVVERIQRMTIDEQHR